MGDFHILYDEFEYLDLSEDEKTAMLENTVQTLRNETTAIILWDKVFKIEMSRKVLLKNPCSKYFDFVIYEDNSIITFEKKRGSLTNNDKMIYPPSNYSLKRNYIYRKNDLKEYKKYFDDVHKYGGIIPVNYIDQFSNFNQQHGK